MLRALHGVYDLLELVSLMVGSAGLLMLVPLAFHAGVGGVRYWLLAGTMLMLVGAPIWRLGRELGDEFR